MQGPQKGGAPVVPELNRMLVASSGSAMCGWKPCAAASSPAARKSTQVASPRLNFTCMQQAGVNLWCAISCKALYASAIRDSS